MPEKADGSWRCRTDGVVWFVFLVEVWIPISDIDRVPVRIREGYVIGFFRFDDVAHLDSARGFIRSRRGAGMYVFVPAAVSGFNLRSVMRDAQYRSRTIGLRDDDGNPLYISY